MKTDILKYLEAFKNPSNDGYIPLQSLLDSGINVVEELKTFDLFREVKKINIIPTPIYLGDINGKPLKEVDNYLGGNSKHWHVVEFDYKLEENSLILNEEIDLYSIEPWFKCYSKESELDCGVWNFPLQYDPITYSTINKILIKYSLESIIDAKNMSIIDAKNYTKEIILKQISDIFESKNGLDGSNVPYTQSIKIRCSPRSVQQKIN